VADWLRRGLSPQVSERFADAAVMQHAWREAIRDVFGDERRMPWWRRWFESEEPLGWQEGR
jgi:hypothetical protein